MPKRFSKANDMHPGAVPEYLQNLTQIEEMLIARVSPIMYIYRKHGGQRGYKGHVLNLSQNIQSLLDKLPQAVSKLPVLILRRSGANDTYSDFTVRRQKVLDALVWLKENNPYYKSITIDFDTIAKLPENSVPQDIFVDSSNSTLSTTTCIQEIETAMDTQSPSQFNESDNDDVLLEAENNVQAEDRSQHNYTSFIPVPQQQQTEIEAI